MSLFRVCRHSSKLNSTLFSFCKPQLTQFRTFESSTSVSRGGQIIPFEGVYPKIDKTAFIASNAVLIGKVFVDSDASIWYNCVLRGDVANIKIGKRTNIQDGTVIHCNSARQDINREQMDCIVGDDVTVGHCVLLHACNIHNKAFIGMSSTIMDGVVIEPGAVVAAGALVTPYKVVKSGELWMGSPAKYARQLTEQEIQEYIEWHSKAYVELSKKYD